MRSRALKYCTFRAHSRLSGAIQGHGRNNSELSNAIQSHELNFDLVKLLLRVVQDILFIENEFHMVN